MEHRGLLRCLLHSVTGSYVHLTVMLWNLFYRCFPNCAYAFPLIFPTTFSCSNLRCIGRVVLSDSIKFNMLHSQHIRFLSHVILIEDMALCLNSKRKTKCFKVTVKTQQQCINIYTLLLCFDSDFKPGLFCLPITATSAWRIAHSWLFTADFPTCSHSTLM